MAFTLCMISALVATSHCKEVVLYSLVIFMRDSVLCKIPFVLDPDFTEVK
jgi:hypothetical protein